MGEIWQRPPSTIHAGWRYTIPITDNFVEDPTDEQVPAIAGAIADAIKDARDFDREDEAGQALRDIEDEIRDTESVRELDYVVNELYDWGDGFRVIIK